MKFTLFSILLFVSIGSWGQTRIHVIKEYMFNDWERENNLPGRLSSEHHYSDAGLLILLRQFYLYSPDYTETTFHYDPQDRLIETLLTQCAIKNGDTTFTVTHKQNLYDGNILKEQTTSYNGKPYERIEYNRNLAGDKRQQLVYRSEALHSTITETYSSNNRLMKTESDGIDYYSASYLFYDLYGREAKRLEKMVPKNYGSDTTISLKITAYAEGDTVDICKASYDSAYKYMEFNVYGTRGKILLTRNLYKDGEGSTRYYYDNLDSLVKTIYKHPYGGSYVTEYRRDNKGRLLSKHRESLNPRFETKFINNYDGEKLRARFTCFQNGEVDSTTYVYDEEGRLAEIQTTKQGYPKILFYYNKEDSLIKTATLSESRNPNYLTTDSYVWSNDKGTSKKQKIPDPPAKLIDTTYVYYAYFNGRRDGVWLDMLPPVSHPGSMPSFNEYKYPYKSLYEMYRERGWFRLKTDTLQTTRSAEGTEYKLTYQIRVGYGYPQVIDTVTLVHVEKLDPYGNILSIEEYDQFKNKIFFWEKDGNSYIRRYKKESYTYDEKGNFAIYTYDKLPSGYAEKRIYYENGLKVLELNRRTDHITWDSTRFEYEDGLLKYEKKESADPAGRYKFYRSYHYDRNNMLMEVRYYDKGRDVYQINYIKMVGNKILEEQRGNVGGHLYYAYTYE